jgi:site-specific DNA recombinase
VKSEQNRIAGQLTRIEEQLASLDANFEQARRTPADKLNLTQDCDAAYLEANDSTRRLFNQAFFAKIYIDEDDETRERSIRVDYNEPFDSLLSRLIPARVHHTLDIEKTAHPDTSEGGPETSFEGTAKVHGSHTDTLVEVSGLEPPTSTLRT